MLFVLTTAIFKNGRGESPWKPCFLSICVCTQQLLIYVMKLLCNRYIKIGGYFKMDAKPIRRPAEMLIILT